MHFRKIRKHYFLGMVLLLLVGCYLPAVPVEMPQPTLAPATEMPAETVAASPTFGVPAATATDPAPTSTVEPSPIPPVVVIVTVPPVPTAVPQQSPTKTLPPLISEPFIVTHGETMVRAGPGVQYDQTYWIAPGAYVPVQGRSPDGLWWAVPGAGDGPGPLGWVIAEDVDFTGNRANIIVIDPPATRVPDVPVHWDPGAPPADTCVVTPFGGGAPVLVRLGPGEQFNVTYRLGGWAEVLNHEGTWYMLWLGPGETGWVNGAEVEASGPCP